MPQGFNNFSKNTHTRQYFNMDSFTLLKWKMVWIPSLVYQAKKMCSKEKLPEELHLIKKFACWNGYPKNIANAIIKRVLLKETLANDIVYDEEKDITPMICVNID